jgi:hypothetical protein
MTLDSRIASLSSGKMPFLDYLRIHFSFGDFGKAGRFNSRIRDWK